LLKSTKDDVINSIQERASQEYSIEYDVDGPSKLSEAEGAYSVDRQVSENVAAAISKATEACSTDSLPSLDAKDAHKQSGNTTVQVEISADIREQMGCKVGKAESTHRSSDKTRKNSDASRFVDATDLIAQCLEKEMAKRRWQMLRAWFRRESRTVRTGSRSQDMREADKQHDVAARQAAANDQQVEVADKTDDPSAQLFDLNQDIDFELETESSEAQESMNAKSAEMNTGDLSRPWRHMQRQKRRGVGLLPLSVLGILRVQP
jgi:hypothetical protein